MSDEDPLEAAGEAADPWSNGEEMPGLDADEGDGADWATAGKQWVVTALHTPVLATNAVMNGLDTFGGNRIPGTTKVWGWLLKSSYKGYKRATGADLMGHELKQGRLLHKPLVWNADTGRWETKSGEEWWNGRDDGADTYLGPGGVPCAWAAAQASQLGTNVQAETAEALDLGMGKALMADGEVSVYSAMGEAQNGQAVADGGVAQMASGRFDVDHPGLLKDFVVPLNKLYVGDDGEAIDARLISLDKYYQTYPETVESEEHQKAETRGRLAEQDKDMSSYAMKMLLIAGAVIVLSLLAVFVLPEFIGGGGGGGGGSMIPLTLGLLGLV